MMDFQQQGCVESVFSRPPVYNNILRQLSPASCVRVGHTCRVARDSVLDFSFRAFNINRHLLHFFSDPISFRSLQARTNTLISGSSALQFLDRTFYPEADLDLYVHPGHSFEVGLWLMKREGYEFFPSASQEGNTFFDLVKDDWDGLATRYNRHVDPDIQRYRISGLSDVYTFKKVSQNPDAPPLKVQIMASESNALQCVLGFHSTCVMNVISYNAAYSLYPRATFEERISLCMNVANSSEVDAIGKYKVRGWRIYSEVLPHHEETSPFYLLDTRWLDDDKSWVVPLDTTGVYKRLPLSATSPEFDWDPAIQNSWRLVQGRNTTMRYYEVKSTVFRYNYTVADQKFAEELHNWCHLKGTNEHAFTATLSKEQKRKAWTWWDAEIAAFRRGYLKQEKQKMLVEN